ncbi:MAG: phage tail protein [Bacteroidota bacterium]
MKSSQKGRYLIYLVILFLTLNSCQVDTFWDTIRYITTSKVEYEIGDTLDVVLNVETYDEEKIIRVYDNFKNTSISLSLINEDLGVLNEEWSQWSLRTLPKSQIREIEITPDSPFKKLFQGVISTEGDSVKITFPELNLIAKYSKERLRRDSLRIHGFCMPINPGSADSLEDYFDIKDVKIKV